MILWCLVCLFIYKLTGIIVHLKLQENMQKVDGNTKLKQRKSGKGYVSLYLHSLIILWRIKMPVNCFNPLGHVH